MWQYRERINYYEKVRRSLYEVLRFTVSLSCGLATYPSYPNAELLTEATGNALAEAKRRGQSRVALFD